MTLYLKSSVSVSRAAFTCRTFRTSTVLETKKWRLNRGLNVNRNTESILADTPDYTYLDGRPTPLLHKQKLRILQQQQYASQIVELCSEIDFAKERYSKMQQEKEQERQNILNNRLKPKGDVTGK